MAADDSNSVSDTALNVQNTNLSSAVPTESSQNYTITPDPIISGTVTQCGSTDPFPGVNVTVCDVNGNILASTITDQNGFYTVAFLSDQTTFKVIAHLVGHIPDSKDVTVSPNPNDPSDPNLYATADLELGPFAIFLNHGSSNMNTIDAVSDSEYGPFASLAQSHPVDVAITPDGKTAVIACWGHITYFVDITDPTNPSVIGSVSNPNINSAYVSLTPDGKYALVTGLGPPGVIYVIEVATRTLVYTYIDPTTNLFGVGVVPDGQTVIATKYDTNQVNILTIDPSSGLLTSLYTLSTGLGPSSVAISPDGRTALVTNQNGASVSVLRIDGVGNVVVSQPPITGLPGNPTSIAFSPDGTKAYVTCYPNTIALLNVTGPGIVSDSGITISLPGTSNVGGGKMIAVSPDGTKAYTTLRQSNLVAVLDLTTNTVTGALPSGSEPIGIAFAPQSAALELTKTVNNTSPTVHDTIIYTLIVQNHGPNAATSVQVTDVLPQSELTFVGVDSVDYGYYDNGVWTIPNLPANTIAHLVLRFTVDRAGTIENKATITSLTYDPELYPSNVTVSISAQDITQPISEVNAQTVPFSKVNSPTVGMQTTGAPIGLLLLAILMVLSGIIVPKRK